MRNRGPIVRKSRWNLTSGPEDNSSVRVFCDGLMQIELKTLTRPSHDEVKGWSPKELRWALRVFTGGSMCFFRDLLKSYLVIREKKLEAVSFLVLRAMYETICGAHYANEHYTLHMRAGELDAAWKLLNKCNVGSKVLKYQQPNSGATEEHEVPVKMWDAINSLETLDPSADKGWAYELYRQLSEFSHPDFFVFAHYCEMDKDPNRVSFYTQPEPDQGFLRKSVGTFIGLAGIVYGNLLRSAELRTPERELAKLVAEFQEADLKYPKAKVRSSGW